MTLVKNKNFINIFKSHKPANINSLEETYDPLGHPYIGMGNPDSNLLFVGSEKGFNPDISPKIALHELNLNFSHWRDIVSHYQNLNDALHPALKLRSGLEGFNPFSPLTLEETAHAVYSKGGHTYAQMEKIINVILKSFHYMSPRSRFQISPRHYHHSIFNYCFLTEISDLPKVSQDAGEEFTHERLTQSPRYTHLTGMLSDFYQSFQTVVIYAGLKYSGLRESAQRLDIIRLFNKNLTNTDLVNIQRNSKDDWLFDEYQSPKGGAKVIVCKHITRGCTSEDLKHYLGVIGIGDIL